MPYIPTANMTHEEWLRARHRTIGSSDVGSILGLNKWKTPLQVWREKTSEEPQKETRTDATEWGLRLEDDVADYYAEVTGHRVLRDNKIRQHPEFPYLTCNIDRLIVHKDEGLREEQGRGILEIKTTVAYAMREWETDVPLSYYAQVQHQMLVSGYTWGEFAILVLDKRQFLRVPFKADFDFQLRMLEAAEAFWENYIVPGIEPPMQVPDFEVAQSEPDKVVEADTTLLEACTELSLVRNQIKELESKESELTDRLKEAIGLGEILAANGKALATWKTDRKVPRKFDAKAFEKDNPALYAKYVVEGQPVRRFIFKFQPSWE